MEPTHGSQKTGRRRIRRLAPAAILAILLLVGGGVFLYSQTSTNRSDEAEPAAGTADSRKPPRQSKQWSPPATPRGGYVGSQACADCHEELHRSYQGHPMAKATAKVSEARPLEDYTDQTSFVTRRSRRYRVEKTDDGVFHHEIMLDADGQPIYDQAVEVDYAIGSGKRGRTYVIDRGGLLFESPITWYTQEGRWDLSPGYDRRNHNRFERRIVHQCIHCHTGRVNVDPEGQNRFRDPPVLEGGIGCERCHGPGQRHIAYHSGSASTDLQADPIVNPADLEPARREAVCNQCHLQGASRILRYGRSAYDFRPGNRLDDVWAIFVKGAGVDAARRTEAVSQVEQMRASACYRGSNGTLSCTSCHDPHAAPPAEEQKAAFYRRRCLQCHEDHGCSLPIERRRTSNTGNSCMACHMPSLEASDIPHTTQTDHRILRRPDEAPETEGVPQIALYGDTREQLTSLQRDRARGLMLRNLIAKTGETGWAWDVERLLRPVLEQAPDDVPVLEALGTASSWQNRLDDAEKYWKQALESQPERESVLERLAGLCRKQGRFPESRAYWERLLELNRWRGEYYGRYAHVLGNLNQLDQGIRAAERGIKLDPTLEQLYTWLAKAYELKGNSQKARHYRQRMERIQER